MAVTSNTETRTPEARPKKIGGTKPGIYVGKVINHLDTEFMGALEVQLLKQTAAGNTPNEAGQTIKCTYASPFFGVTPYVGTSENEGFDYTQKSYGFWAVPPDIDTKVLVLITEGESGEAFWVGCVPDKYMNFMTPGNPSTTYNSEDNTKSRPVGEYNKRTEEAVGNDPTQFVKPCHVDACAVLDNNGLADDTIRGTNSSSARREVPSMVFGWSSPGPLDRRPGKPTTKTGESFQGIETPASRLTGTTIVMDDGDPSLYRKGSPNETPAEYVKLSDGGDPTRPLGESFRIRTRTGHQILLHNSEDLIYISHGSGKSWIEMSANGKIDIYAEDSISMHTQNDFNFKADRNINFEAGNSINLKAGNVMTTETGSDWQVKVGADGKITCAGSSNIKSKHHKETADRIDMNGSNAAAEAESANVPLRQPTAEPFLGHENKNPAEHTPEKTDNDPEANNTLNEETGSTTEDKEKKTDDTFKKCPPAEKTDEQKEEDARLQNQGPNNAQNQNAVLTRSAGPGGNGGV